MARGRPTKLTTDISKRICDAIRIGTTRLLAAEYAGVSERTFYRWIKAGKQAKSGKLKDFCHALKRAEAEGVVNNLSRIQNAGIGKIKNDRGEWEKFEGQWQALAWILERRHPKEYGRNRTDDEPGTAMALAEALKLLRGDQNGDSDADE